MFCRTHFQTGFWRGSPENGYRQRLMCQKPMFTTQNHHWHSQGGPFQKFLGDPCSRKDDVSLLRLLPRPVFLMWELVTDKQALLVCCIGWDDADYRLWKVHSCHLIIAGKLNFKDIGLSANKRLLEACRVEQWWLWKGKGSHTWISDLWIPRIKRTFCLPRNRKGSKSH